MKTNLMKINIDYQILYSALISDKMSAARVTPVDEKYISFDALNNQKIQLLVTINHANWIALEMKYSHSDRQYPKKYQTDSVFTITAPTGTGKHTLVFSEKAPRSVRGNKNNICSSIYSYYRSNYQKIEELHKMNEDFSVNKSNYIIIHHHLSKKNI